MLSLIGPLNSGVAAGGAGSATSNATTDTIVRALLRGIVVRYNDSPPGTTDVTVATAGVTIPVSYTLLTLTNANTDGFFGEAAPVSGGTDAFQPFAVYDTLKVTIAGANDGDSVDVWFLVDP